VTAFILIAFYLSVVSASGQTTVSQSSVITVNLAQDQVASLKTARGIITRLVFNDRVQEIICGDLYDPASGFGTFVIQRDGNEVFLKPVASQGVSNLFVKTGSNSDVTYSFDLYIGATQNAFRIVRIMPITTLTDIESRPVKASAKAAIKLPLIQQVEDTPEFAEFIPDGLPKTIKLSQLAPAPLPSSAVNASVRKSSERVATSESSGERKVIHRVKPVYPDAARRNAAYG